MVREEVVGGATGLQLNVVQSFKLSVADLILTVVYRSTVEVRLMTEREEIE